MSSVTEPEEMTDSNYCPSLLQMFSQFRMEQAFCDYTITVGDDAFKVHKVMMAAGCDYFRAMFSHGMVDSESSTHDLQMLTVDGVKPLLDYVYTGKLYLSMTNVYAILPAAAFLQVTSALNLIARYLKNQMTFENADKIVGLANTYGLTDLGVHHRNMILERFLEFSDTEQFLALDAETLIDYLEQDSLRTTTEAQLLKRVLRWYNHDPERREPGIHAVFDRIRYTIDGWPAIEYAYSQPVFQTNEQCKQIIVRCNAYMHDAQRKHLNQSYRTRVRYESQTLVQIGGVKLSMNDFTLGFLLPGEDEYDEEQHGTSRNHYYHKNLGMWLPLGVNGTTDCRSHCTIVAINDFGVLIGGYLYSSNFERTIRHCTNEVRLFTPGDFALWDMPFMLEGRAQHVAVHIPGFIYVIGGKTDTGPSRTVEQFHVDNEVWKFVKSLDLPVYDHAGASYENKIFISGGIVNNTIVDTVLCYDPNDDDWTVAPPLLIPRAGHTMTLLNNQFFVCGGHTVYNSSRCLASVEMYDHEVKQWTYITPMRTDRAFASASVLDGKLMIVGGENSLGELQDDIAEFDPVSVKWSKYCTLPEPMKNIGCVSVTIKLTPTGEDDQDSVTEECHRYEESEEDYDFYDSDDDGEIIIW